MTREFPPFLHDLLASPPRAGEGVHPWLFRVARQLHAHLPAGEIVRLLETQVASCGRNVPRSEIVAAVQNALACAWQPNGRAAPAQAATKWPSLNEEHARPFCLTVRDSQTFGKHRLSGWTITTSTLRKSLTAYFPANRSCVAASPTQLLTPARVRTGGGNCRSLCSWSRRPCPPSRA